MGDVFAVISPAKKLDFKPTLGRVPLTAPALFKETQALTETTSKLSAADLKKLMSLSDSLAKLNYQRFQSFDANNSKPEGAKQAVLAFDGDTYVGLRAREMSTEDLAYSQEHLGILSGLYGILRPLDAILPYRLEMGSKLKTPRGKSLYDFWGDKVAKKVGERVKKSGSPVLVNLASKEYFSVMPEAALKSRVVTPVFKEKRGSGSQIISFLAKRARGAMARYIVVHRVDDPEGLKDFSEDGYRYQKAQSSADEWVFLR